MMNRLKTKVAARGADPSALFRVRLAYLWRHGRLPRLDKPTLFTELVQVRKLYDRDARLPVMADKLAVKALVADRLGSKWVVPTLWSGKTLPDVSRWSQSIVIKSRHGCNHTAILRDGDANWANLKRLTKKWMRSSYGAWLDEWLYTHIPRGLLIEPFIGKGNKLPIDYKFYVFDGEVTHIQVHLDRMSNHRWFVFDKNWRAISKCDDEICRPSALAAMIEAAEEMGRGLSFSRVDLYQPDDRPLFGEITFYPGSGLDRFDPPGLDAEMGALWLRAEGCQLSSSHLRPTLCPQFRG